VRGHHTIAIVHRSFDLIIINHHDKPLLQTTEDVMSTMQLQTSAAISS
jgi:hypothetical protein